MLVKSPGQSSVELLAKNSFAPEDKDLSAALAQEAVICWGKPGHPDWAAANVDLARLLHQLESHQVWQHTLTYKLLHPLEMACAAVATSTVVTASLSRFECG